MDIEFHKIASGQLKRRDSELETARVRHAISALDDAANAARPALAYSQ